LDRFRITGRPCYRPASFGWEAIDGFRWKYAGRRRGRVDWGESKALLHHLRPIPDDRRIGMTFAAQFLYSRLPVFEIEVTRLCRKSGSTAVALVIDHADDQ
jgi:hypothetical protein